MKKRHYTKEDRALIYQQYLASKNVTKTARDLGYDANIVQKVINDNLEEKGELQVEKEKIDFEARISEQIFQKAIYGMEKSLDHILHYLKEEKDSDTLKKQIRDIITTFGIISDKIFKLVEIKKFGRPIQRSDETQMILIERMIQVVEKYVPQEALVSVVRELEESAVDRSSLNKGKTGTEKE